MNEFDLHVHSVNRQLELQHEREKWQLAQTAQEKHLKSAPEGNGDEASPHHPALARLGAFLIDVGEGLIARYGEALENLPASATVTDSHPKSV